jgi:hypothetical protein
LPLPCPYRYVLFDHDAKFGRDVFDFLQTSGIEPTRTSVRSARQSGVAERWADSVRREMLDHVILLNERHLRRLCLEYLAYYHEDRMHIGLNKATPARRPIELRTTDTNRIQSRPRIAGLITDTNGQKLPDPQQNTSLRSSFQVY